MAASLQITGIVFSREGIDVNRYLKCTLVLLLGLPIGAVWLVFMTLAVLVAIPLMPLSVAGCIDFDPMDWAMDTSIQFTEWLRYV